MTGVALLDVILEDIERMIREGTLMNPPRPLAGGAVRVVESFDEALDCARHRATTADEDALSWLDLRAKEAARLLGSTYGDPAMTPVRAAIRGLGQRIADQVTAHLPAAFEAALDDIVADLQAIVLARVATEAEPGLHARMWDAYRGGCWPCGWEGPFPRGCLIVFQPPRSRPSA